MSVKISPRDRVVVTNFRYNPGSQISLFSLKEVQTAIGDMANGDVLVWNGSGFVSSNTITADIFGGTYDQTGSLGGSTLQLRYSEVAEKPLDGSLKQGELAYSFLPDNWDGLKWDGGQTLYVGDSNGNAIAIGSKRVYDYANHEDGVTVANSFLIVGGDKDVDTLKIGDIRFDGSTLNVENAGSNLYLSPGGLAHISATGHRIINLQDPVDSQDAVTKNYVDTALANYSVAPVTIADAPPASPDKGDLWYDAANTFRLYVWDDVTAAWVDASPNTGDDTHVEVANVPPSDPKSGDLWYDTADTYRLYVWDATSDAWVDASPDAPVDTTHAHVADAPPVNPKSGDFWYDSSDTYRLYVWDDVATAWVDASPNMGDQTHVTVADTPPADPASGDLWYDSANTYRLYVWDDVATAWVDASPNVDTVQPLIVIANTAPANPEVGLAWYDSANTGEGTGRTYTWDGEQWVDIAPQGGAAVANTTALIIIANDPPNAPDVGTAWYDSDPVSTTSGRTFVWDGATWVDIAPQGADEPHSIISSVAPSMPEYGDIWVDSSSNNTPFVWDGAQWLNIAPQATQKPPVTIAAFPPTEEIGYLWYDSDNTGRTFVWDGVQWVDIAPQNDVDQIADSRISLTKPISPYDGQVWFDSLNEIGYVWESGSWLKMSDPNSGTPHVLIGSSAPSYGISVGDLWFDTSANTPMLYTNSGWIPFVTHPETSNGAFILVSNDPPIAPEIGQAWYDSDTTGRTFVWDGIQWVDISPNEVSTNSWVKIHENTNITGIGSTTISVDSSYKKIVVTLENMATLDNSVTFSGVVVSGLTVNGNTYDLTEHLVNIFTYPVSTRMEIETYQNNGTEPTTFLVNKYNDSLQSITVKPKIASDTFTSGSLAVWALT